MGERSFAKESAVCRNIYRKVATSTHLLFQVCTSNSLTMLALALNGIQCTGNLGTKNNTSGVGESRLDSMGLWYSLMMSGSSHHSLKLDILFDNFCNMSPLPAYKLHLGRLVLLLTTCPAPGPVLAYSMCSKTFVPWMNTYYLIEYLLPLSVRMASTSGVNGFF